MKLIVDIPEEEYEFCKRQWDTECLDELMIAVKYGTPLKDWLQTFNTDSATECFTAVQRLKESMGYGKNDTKF